MLDSWDMYISRVIHLAKAETYDFSENEKDIRRLVVQISRFFT